MEGRFQRIDIPRSKSASSPPSSEAFVDTSRDNCRSAHRVANKVGRVAWTVCWWVLFRPSPRVFYRWRVTLLRLFGARVHRTSRIDPSARVWAPWNLSVGADTSVGHHVDLYNVAPIFLGNRVTVSQESLLCTASHEISDPAMGLTRQAIRLDDESWACARAYLGPGVRLGQGAVAGACAVVTKSVDPWKVVVGNPAAVLKERKLCHV